MRFLPFLALLACGDAAPPSETTPEAPAAEADAKAEAPKHAALFKPLPKDMAVDGKARTEAMIDLGRQLYYDARLSKNHDISCNSCHMLDKYGQDGEPTSPGHKGQRGGRNSPTTYNAALHLSQFWDGRAADVEEQAKGPVLNPVEMAMPDEGYVLKVLTSIPGYQEGFKAAFPDDEDPITYDNFAKAVGAFERGLVTPAPFDKYLEGDAAALTDEQKAGLDLYVSTGCTTCHNGVAVGGAMYQKLGLVKPYETADKGRGDLTGNEAENYFFKVPSLRNITETAPYFHDGSIASLDEAVKLMASHQLGKELDDAQVKSIVTFLGALKGEPDAAYIAKPELPESGPETPKADPS
ncbi:MAG: c-type cytochrome [Deltaproteobacteria bacterium]|nr:MAG: c-type cytochrome [Deltaproteobacteria bacterium]